MSQILVFSFDCPSSPSIVLKAPATFEDMHEKAYGRGFAWYNHEELSATLVKEAKFSQPSHLAHIMQDASKFYSTIFIGHVRGAAKRLVQQDTQPFTRSYAGRNWIFVHSGDLQSDYASFFSLGKNAFFEPMGSTDSEYIFCYLLEKIREKGARSLADISPDIIFSWFKEINQLGTANFILSDGLDIIIYHDMNSFNPLYLLRSCPPHEKTSFESDIFSIDITVPFDVNHTFVLISNEKLDSRSQLMHSGQMVVLRRGQIGWNSVRGAISESEKIERKTLQPVSKEKSKILSVYHETIYRYENPVELSKHIFHLHPVSDHVQAVLKHQLSVSVQGQSDLFEDVFGNLATLYQINSAYTELIIKSESLVKVFHDPVHQSDYVHQRREFPLVWLPWQHQMMSPYLLPMELPESELNELIEFAMSFVKRNDYDLMEVLKDINQTIYRDFRYVPGSTSLTATPYDLYQSREGVCQDFTNLFICLARLLNIPTRYRIGYIFTGADYDNKIQSEASHAWVECFLPYIGWYGFDPTNGCVVEQNHVRIACGRHYLDASPTSGTIYKGGGGESLQVDVQVKIEDTN